VKRILVTGSQGQLGRELAKTQPLGVRVDYLGRKELDITDPAAVKARLAKGYEVVINAAAYTQVDQAEREPEQAFLVNQTGVEHLAQACVQTECLLVQISTDYLFDGHSSIPIVETASPHPLGVYGRSKLGGEQAMAVLSKGLILRTGWLYSGFGTNFVKTMLRLAKERNEIKVVHDQVGGPTYAEDLATGIWRLLECPVKNLEIYNFANQGVYSWFEFAQLIFSEIQWSGSLLPISTQEYGAKAPRPAYSVLDTTKYQTAIGNIPPVPQALHRMLNSL